MISYWDCAIPDSMFTKSGEKGKRRPDCTSIARACSPDALDGQKGWFQGELCDLYIRHSSNPSSKLPDTG